MLRAAMTDAPIDHDNLEEFRAPEDYDAEHGALDADGAFMVAFAAATGGPVLDIACGTGRIALPLARAGIRVTGIDLSAHMLERARSQSAGLPLTLHLADVRDFTLHEGPFACATMAGHAFQQMLDDADQRALFRCVHRHLATGGLFVFDSRNPNGQETCDTKGEEFWHSYIGADGKPGETSTESRWDEARQLLHYTVIRRRPGRAKGESAETRQRISLRYTPADLLARHLVAEGFVALAQYGDWTWGPVRQDSYEIVTVARKL
jgi:SAM-dependent methyltransferase